MELKGSLVDSFKLVAFQIVYYLIRCIPSRPKQKYLLLVKTDEIGDYVLARNFLGKFREGRIYKEHRICIVANAACKSLYAAYDNEIADEVIWLDKVKFRRDLYYRWKILKQIRLAGFSDAVNLVYSRSFRYDDLLIAVSTSANNIAMGSFPLPKTRVEIKLTPGGIYHHLIDSGEVTLFDAIRNARFIEKITEAPIFRITTDIPIHASGDNRSGLERPAAGTYFVVFPGSSQKARKWPAASFAIVARYIADTHGATLVVCGAPGDKPECDEFIAVWEQTMQQDGSRERPLIDYTGKTNLPQFLEILSTALCIISVDTGAVHLAAAVQCPVFAVFSGLFYGRFSPYPVEIASRFYPVYPDSTEVRIANGSIKDNLDIPLDLIKNIPPQKLINKINDCLIS